MQLKLQIYDFVTNELPLKYETTMGEEELDFQGVSAKE